MIVLKIRVIIRIESRRVMYINHVFVCTRESVCVCVFVCVSACVCECVYAQNACRTGFCTKHGREKQSKRQSVGGGEGEGGRASEAEARKRKKKTSRESACA